MPVNYDKKNKFLYGKEPTTQFCMFSFGRGFRNSFKKYFDHEKKNANESNIEPNPLFSLMSRHYTWNLIFCE